ncbi:group II intron reverse transcriptase/maturase [Paenibacillus periandrae]|uniref:group II intron reverse transcriptase/maturase n=1 Tax=Paenibacillus periandrae TaxID=1761741 RepID=UPI001F094A9C|nr:group II intron reverse transcriptase/maturase [Paenibacillus periandrae]
MVQKFDYPKSETSLRNIQDELYAQTYKAIEMGIKPNFKGLLEIISSEATILTAIHNIKANKGSQTPGSDGENIREFILEKEYLSVIERVQMSFKNYKALPVRRVLIPKPGKTEKRPLGIPTIIDRIVQECVRLVIEPILEAQFFKHSYGFRPMRDAHMALERVKDVVYKTGFHWIVEGDISKFFDNVNHNILLKRLWHMGIHDRRVLMIIKAMLKAGIMNESDTNVLGTPQGGIISPLLANVYLDAMDQWIVREWEEKKTIHKYSANNNKFQALRKSVNLKEAYLIRYADDWVLITDSRRNAEKWRWRISNYLKEMLKLRLSDEKTLITNIRKKSIKFVGFEFKLTRGKSKSGYISRVSPNNERIKSKVEKVRQAINNLRYTERHIGHQINLINSIIRGLIEYYQPANTVNVSFQKYQKRLNDAAISALQRRRSRGKGKRIAVYIPANEVHNLISVHSQYTTKILTVVLDGMKIGLTQLSFCRWKLAPLKNQEETPYSVEGRKLYMNRCNKKPLAARADDLLSEHLSAVLAYNQPDNKYNFEYFLNRAYAFNRDRGKCRVCGLEVASHDVEIHHVKPKLPLYMVNRVKELATLHNYCHDMIHEIKDYSNLSKKIWTKILYFREKLEVTDLT